MNEIYKINHNSDFIVNVEFFEGPLNVLLEMLLKKKDSVYQIKITDIIQKFIRHIHNNTSNRLETLSGFLYIISIMLNLKSRSLLPSKSEKTTFNDETDSAEILKEREDEYRAFRNISEYFLELIENEEIYYLREAPVEEQLFDTLNEVFKKIKAKDLHDAASRLISAKEERFNFVEFYGKKNIKNIFHEIKRIKNILTSKNNISFKELTNDYIEMIDIVIAFLSILELYKNEAIDIEQFEIFGEIIIKKISA